MLVKINSINEVEYTVKVIMLDIDDYGSIMPLKELELNIPSNDDSIINVLKNSSYAAIFTDDGYDNNNSTIIWANGMTYDDINEEKKKTIDIAMGKKERVN